VDVLLSIPEPSVPLFISPVVVGGGAAASSKPAVPGVRCPEPANGL
jgi:hypothetical protein